MIIIVEGIDRVGKTTLCKKLSSAFDIPVYKHNSVYFDYSKMDNANETDKMLQIIDVIKQCNGSIIFDRFHLSDFVYGVIERKYDESLAKRNMNIIDNALASGSKKVALILVKPTDIVRSSEEHGKNLDLYENLFESAFEHASVFKMTCDFLTLDKVVEAIANNLQGESR